MKINKLELNNFRNYSYTKTNFEDGLNFIVGTNAQGKTNLLESIYLLSVGKSPKNSKEKQLIKFNQTKSKVAVSFHTIAGNKDIAMYLDKTDKKSIKVNNLNILKLTELVGTLSVVYFSPDELKLIKDVPEDRRNFLDISISQFDKAYLYDLMKYNRILKMRNQILKSFDTNESKVEQLKLFTPQLIDTAEKIIEKRLNFIENIKNIAKNIHKTITLTENLDISYSYSIKENLSIKEDLVEQFNNSIEKELELGYTSIGPHRDDIIFKINDLDCKHFASQGQQRTVALVVKLSLMEVIREEIGEYPILLLDDVLSELDQDRQDRLLNLTTKYQTFISCTSIPNTNLTYNKKEIKNGKVIS
ncbi:MAG: DNA replication/repair protein RecF [Clostridia bacterium]|nr:DNA replication/repair protein RecF [Clostridia bacterium]